MTSRVLHLYRTLERRPLGRWLFSRLVCWKAPYFSGIAPRMVALEPGRGEATIRHRRRVTNHLGTVHAIALCNLAEFIGGLTTDASIPASMRWIPRGMTVEYLKKAVGTMRAVATPAFLPREAGAGYELPVQVEVTDPAGDAVFRARIAMWVSPRRVDCPPARTTLATRSPEPPLPGIRSTMSTDTLLLLCALHSFGFALFHLGFWRLFGWPRTLAGTTRPNRAIVQIANLQLVWVFIAVGLLCLLYPDELTTTPLGRAVLAGMAIFWAIRTLAQFVWLRMHHPLVHALTALFVLGIGLFAAPLLA